MRKSIYRFWTAVAVAAVVLLALATPATAKPTAWGPWQGLGVCQWGCITPTVASWAPGHLDVFALSRDFRLIQNTYDSGLWSGWKMIGGPELTMRSVRAVSWGPGRIDLFAQAGDRLAYIYYANGAWSSWAYSLDAWGDQIAVSSWGPNRFDLFINKPLNPENPELTELWHLPYDGNWLPWEYLGDHAFAGDAVSTRPGRIDLFAASDLDTIHRRYEGGGWTGWTNLGGPYLTGPAVAGQGDRLDVFIEGRDEQLYQKTFNGSWSAWQPVDMGPYRAITDPGAFSWGPGRIDLFGQTPRDAPHAVVHKAFTG